MIRLDTRFFDVGGVCLTNGWDTDARLAAASHIVLGVEETGGRHQALADGSGHGELNTRFTHQSPAASSSTSAARV